jgi:hypothetical protein
LEPPAGTTAQVLDTSVEPSLDGRAVVAFRIKAVAEQAGYGLTVSADIQARPISDATPASCPADIPADPLTAADPGAVFPVYSAASGREGGVVDGWLTFRSRTSAPDCIFTVRLHVDYQPVGTSPSSAPTETVAATVQVFGDGSAVRATQRTTDLPASSLPANVARNISILPALADLDREWHATSLPVVAPLLVSGVDGISEWARRTQAARGRLAKIYASMQKLSDALPASATTDCGDLVATYGQKLQALTDLARAAKSGDTFAAQTAAGVLRLATDDAPRVLRRMIDEYAPYLTPGQAATVAAFGL